LPKSLLKTRPSTLTEAGQSYGPYSGYPSPTAAASVVTFQVDPGWYSPWEARFRIGSPSLVPKSCRNSRSEIPPVQMLGSYVG